MFEHCFRLSKAYFCVYFHLQRSIKDPGNRDFRSKICSFWPIWGVIFGHFGGQKSRFLDFFKVVLDLFRKCLGIVFGFLGPTFACSFTWSINDPDNCGLGSKKCSFLPTWGVIFDNFGGRKSHFLDFFKVVLELFRKFGHSFWLSRA